MPLPVSRWTTSRVQRARVAATCLAIGVLLAASLPPWGWWPLAFGAVVLLDRVLDGVPAKSRLARGTLMGFAFLGPTMAWLKELTLPGYLIAVALFSVSIGVFLMAVPPHAGRRLALPGAWILLEAFRSRWPFGGVPLSLLATGQVAGPLAGLARVGGVLLIAGVTVAVGVGIAAAVGRQPRPALVALAVPLVLVAFAGVAPRGHETGRKVSVAYVQGGGPQGTRAIDSDMRKVFLRHLTASDRVPEGLDLVLWPEDVVDTDGPVMQYREGQELAALAQRLRTTLIVGTVETVSDTKFRNAARVFNAKGQLVDTYEKVHRVPFGEFVPFRSLIERVAPATLQQRDAIVGRRPPVLRTPVAKVAVVISWEVFFGDRARAGINHGGQLLINPTNGSTYTGTLVQSQQIASSRLRAIETGRWEVQVAPTGFSGFVTPDGQVLQRTAIGKRAVGVRRDIALRSGRTLYVRTGDRPIELVALLLVAAGWVLARRDRGDQADRPRQAERVTPPPPRSA